MYAVLGIVYPFTSGFQSIASLQYSFMSAISMSKSRKVECTTLSQSSSEKYEDVVMEEVLLNTSHC